MYTIHYRVIFYIYFIIFTIVNILFHGFKCAVSAVNVAVTPPDETFAIINETVTTTKVNI